MDLRSGGSPLDKLETHLQLIQARLKICPIIEGQLKQLPTKTG